MSSTCIRCNKAMMKFGDIYVYICDDCGVAVSNEECPVCQSKTIFDLATSVLRCKDNDCNWEKKFDGFSVNENPKRKQHMPAEKVQPSMPFLRHKPNEKPTGGNENEDSVTRYSSYAIQPIEFIMANDLGFAEGNIVKYITRWKDKNGIEDLKKAKTYIEFLIHKEESGTPIKEDK